MPDYSNTLGDAVRRARMKLDLTQSEVAESIDVDVRTVLNIENSKGNPKMEVLYPLVRALKIDAKDMTKVRISPAMGTMTFSDRDWIMEKTPPFHAAGVFPTSPAISPI